MAGAVVGDPREEWIPVRMVTAWTFLVDRLRRVWG
jgi:hypothetical protein